MRKTPETAFALRLASALGTLLGARTAGAKTSKLLVFVQTVIKQRALQTLLQKALPGLEVTTVGRVADFGRSLKEGPDAVLTLPVVLQAHGMTPQIRGRRAGAIDEPYALLGVDAAPNIGSLKSVGAIEMLDRAKTNDFVRGLIGRQVKVERVTKVEDLLPLLQLQRADAVLIPLRMLSDIKGTSSLKLSYTELSTRVGLPALAGLGGGGKQTVLQAAKLAGRPAQLLGVDSWQ